MRDIDVLRVEAYLKQRSAKGRPINIRKTSRFEDMERVLLGMKCAIADNEGEVIPALLASISQTQQEKTLWGEQEPSPQTTSLGQEARLVKVMTYVHEHGFITNSLYRELAGVPDRTATRDLETLVERGRLRSIGKRRSRRYELP